MPFNWSVLKRLALLATIAVACPASASADFNLEELIRGNVPHYSVRSDHPRLLITPENRDTIAARIVQSDVGQATWPEVIRTANQGLAIDFTAIPDGDANRGGVYPKFLPYIEAYGVLYQLRDHPRLQGFTYGHTRAEYGAKGVEALMALAKLPQASQIAISGGTSSTLRVTALPLGYDWLHDLLTPEQKQFLVTRLIAITSIWPVNCPVAGSTDTYWCYQPRNPARGGMASAHPRGGEIMNPLAFYGDDVPIDVTIDNVHYTNAQAAAEYMVEGIVKHVWWGPTGSLTRYQVLMPGGVSDEEISYAESHIRFTPVLEAWYTATGEDLFQAGTFWRGFALWHLHDLYPRGANPGRWYYHKMHQAYAENRVLDKFANRDILAHATAWFSRMGDTQSAGVAAWASRLFTGSYLNDRFFYGALLGDPLVTPKSPDAAALPTFHINQDARTFMRSSWEDPDATFAMHSSGQWMCMRSVPQTANSITIWKNGGALLTHQQGYTHDYGPNSRYNIIHIFQPGDYGQVYNDLLRSARGTDNGEIGTPGCADSIDVTRWTDKGGFQRAAIVVPSQYGYSAGDASGYLAAATKTGYTGPSAVTSSDRQFVWFPARAGGSDYFLVYDRVKTTPGMGAQPHAIFNTVGEPQVSADFGQTPIIGESTRQGHWIVKNAPAITITNTQALKEQAPAHARLFAEVLLPQDPVIHRLGGTGVLSTYMATDSAKKRRISNGVQYNDYPVQVDATYAMQIDNTITKDGDSHLNGYGATAGTVDRDCDLYADINQDGAPGVLGVDDDGDGVVDEDSAGCGSAANVDGVGDFEKIAPDCGTPAFTAGSQGYLKSGAPCTYKDDRDFDNNEDNVVSPNGCDMRTISGLWRFQVTSQSARSDNRYLMAMEATDSGRGQPTGQMTLLQGQGIVGAAVAETIGLFNPVYQPLLSGRITLPQTLILPDGATGYRLLIADLEPRAVYSLILGSIEQTATASEAGTIYLEGVTLHPGDTLTLAKIGVAPPPPPPVVRGDVNQDGVVNLRDAIQLLRWITGQPGRPESGTDRFLTADINRDGRLTLADFICLLRGIMAGGTLPC